MRVFDDNGNYITPPPAPFCLRRFLLGVLGFLTFASLGVIFAMLILDWFGYFVDRVVR